MFPGFYGIVVGIGLLLVTGAMAWLGSKGDFFHFDAQGEKGTFEKQLAYYLDIAKFVIGLASGSIVLLVGSAAFHSSGRLPVSFAAPLFLLAGSIIYGIIFMAFVTLEYEAYRHSQQRDTYTRFRYTKNQAFGFGCLSCFCVGYAWLIVIVTGQS